MCAGTWRRESVAAPRYLYDPERKTRDENRTREKPWKKAVKTLEKSGWVIIYMVYVFKSDVHILVIFVVYTCTDLIVLTAGLFGNYPSSSILHWRA